MPIFNTKKKKDKDNRGLEMITEHVDMQIKPEEFRQNKIEETSEDALSIQNIRMARH